MRAYRKTERLTTGHLTSLQGLDGVFEAHNATAALALHAFKKTRVVKALSEIRSSPHRIPICSVQLLMCACASRSSFAE